MQRILEKEMAVLATVRHPNLCSFLGETTSYMGIQYAVIEYTADLNSLSELIHNPSIRVENDVLLSIMKNVADGTYISHPAVPCRAPLSGRTPLGSGRRQLIVGEESSGNPLNSAFLC
jgi:hypothetical protein